MKTAFLSLIVLFLLSACSKNESNDGIKQGYGTFVSEVQTMQNPTSCGTYILLDEGQKLVPSNFMYLNLNPGDRVWVEYEITSSELLCEGSPCHILDFKELECQPYASTIFFDEDSFKMDPVVINDITIDDDCLSINLSYGGGCATHELGLVRLFPSCGTPPLPPPTFFITHDAHADMCEAWITQTVQFDLSPLKEEFDNDVKIVLTAATSGDESFRQEITFKID